MPEQNSPDCDTLARFLADVYDILYLDPKEGYYDPDKEWNADTLQDIADRLHQIVPAPLSKETQIREKLEGIIKSVTIRMVDLSCFARSESIWRFCRRNAIFARTAGMNEVIIECNDKLLAAGEEALKETLMPTDFMELIKQAAAEGKTDPSKKFLLIVHRPS